MQYDLNLGSNQQQCRDKVIDCQLVPINKPIKRNYCNFRNVLSRSCFSNNKISPQTNVCT